MADALYEGEMIASEDTANDVTADHSTFVECIHTPKIIVDYPTSSSRLVAT
jgi:hypothetical protein